MTTKDDDQLTTMEVRGFSVFEEARFDFCPGLNVLIGHNATGKSHAMKLAYTLLDSWSRARRAGNGVGALEEPLRRKLAGVFQPEEGELGRLIRRPHESAEIDLRSGAGRLRLRIDGGTVTTHDLRLPERPTPAVFIPSRETLAMYEGFVAAYEYRELSFDETYYDLCVAMSASPLRPNHLGVLAELLESLEDTLGGRVRLHGNRFYVETDQERTEAHLLAEGLRRIAVVAHLIRNGALSKGRVLFWDEPEANLNPRLVVRMADVLHRLVAAGFQIVLATHDYLLAHALSLAAEHPRDCVETRFLSLYRETADEGVQIESAPTLAEMEHNPILDEYAAHHDRELALYLDDEEEA